MKINRIIIALFPDYYKQFQMGGKCKEEKQNSPPHHRGSFDCLL
jgi:hypothetical protein